MEDFTLVLLAAGEGRRFGGLKQLQHFAPQDATLAEYAIFDAWAEGFRHFVAIVSEQTRETFEQIFQRLGLKQCSQCVVQALPPLPRQKPWGTGHALYAARDAIHTPFIMVNGDDFYGRSAYQKAATFLKQNHKDFALVSYRLKDTLSLNGSVSRALCTLNRGIIEHLQEYLDIHPAGNQIFGTFHNQAQSLDGEQAVSMNFWVLQPSVLEDLEDQWDLFLKQASNDLHAEFYLPVAIENIAHKQHLAIHALPNTDEQWMGLTYASDIQSVQNKIFTLTQDKKYPHTLKILQ